MKNVQGLRSSAARAVPLARWRGEVLMCERYIFGNISLEILTLDDKRYIHTLQKEHSMRKLCAFFSAAAFLLTGCSGLTTKDYTANTPKLDLRQYLNGELEAWGVLYDISGKADLQFTVTMTGTWKGNKGTLEEHFLYSDGRKDTRIWTIAFRDDNNFIATAADVVGEAIGTQDGNAVNMKYTLNAKRASGETIVLSMDDWMYLIDEKSLINRTKMKKFGLTVGELVIGFKKK
jgi:hypothetical protein